jgi:hypothetical protein
MGKMKEMVARQPEPEPAPAPEPTPAPQVPVRGDYFNPWLDPSNAGDNHGPLMFYRQGKWEIGKDEVPLGTKYLVLMPEAQRGWVRFENGKLAETRLTYCRDCVPDPERDTLGYTDESEWETDDGNRPVDPWNARRYLPMEDLETGEIVTWVFWSDGGIKAYEKLSRLYAAVHKTGKLPIVSLQTGTYWNKRFHKDTDIPVLKWVRWHDRDAPQGTVEIIPPDDKPQTAAKTYPPDRITTGGPKRNADMDDDIPF